MKKFYYSLFAAATMLLATSCSQEEDFAQQSSGEKTTFSVSLDGKVGSRAAGDGTNVNKLYCEVYDNTTQTLIVEKEAAKDGTTGGWTLELPLMKSETYDILFWAQVDGDQYYDATDLRNIKVKYDNVSSNIEDRDAFFNALDEFTASGSKHTIVLRRPFAQLNVATTLDDWNEAKQITKKDKPVTASAVKVSSLATNFNVLTGVATATTPATVEFQANDLIDETISIKLEGQEEPSTYKLLAMNYLLPIGDKMPNGLKPYNAAELDKAKDIVEVEFTLYKGEGEQIVNVKVPATPIQRNYRTNIIGDLLTGEDFDIIVDEEFDNTENVEIEISADGIVKDAEGVYHITKPEGLWALANLVNNGSQGTTPAARASSVGYDFDNVTFVLDCDVDLQGAEWTPIDGFKGTFDGNEKTISNFKVNKAISAGLFGNLGVDATIKNLTVTGATILSTHWAGVIVGNGMCLNIENCKVENSSVTVDPTVKDANGEYNGDKAGAIIGYISESEAHITDCEAKNVTIQAYRDLGGIVGYANGTTISGNKVEDIVLVINNTNNYKNYSAEDEYDAGAIVGEAASNSTVADDNTATEETVTIIYTAAETYPGYYVDANGNYCVTEDKGIEAVMDINEENINVILKNDVEVNVTSWQTMAFGGDQTKTITINGENNKLTFKLNDSDWSNVTTANNAKLILNDLEIASSGYNSGHWKRNGICFNCPVEMNNIVSEAILLEQNATLNKVEINEASGAYSIWIWANGQTVNIDGLTINAGTNDSRAIAIKDEDAKGGKVTLNVSNANITSASKAAILVTSKDGADVTLNNVDITKVAADNVAAVWMDEDRADYFDLVNVTGGKKALEGAGFCVDADGNYYATSSTGINNAIKYGAVTVNLLEQEYELGSLSMGDATQVTIKGTDKEKSILNLSKSIYLTGKSIALENLTYNVPINLSYTEQAFSFIHHVESFKMTNCNSNGRLRLNVSTTGTAEIDRCTFNNTTSNGFDGYSIYYYGNTGSKVKVTNSTFNTVGKGIVMYSESAKEFDLTVEKCTFTSSNPDTDKAAIQMHTEYGISGKLIINDTEVKGFIADNDGLWNELNNDTKVTTALFEKIVDGLTYVSDGVSKDAESVYLISSVKGLLYSNENLFKDGGSYKLTQSLDMNDIEWTSNVPQTKNFIFDGGGNTISNWETTSGALLVPKSNYNIEIKNLKLTNCKVNTSSDYAALIIGYADANQIVEIAGIEVNQSEVSGKNYCAALLGWSTKNATISGCSVKNSEFTGGGSTGAYAGHVAGDSSGKVTISDAVVEECEITTNDSNKTKAGIVLGTANIGETTITTSSLQGNKVNGVEDNTIIYGRKVLEGTGKLTVNGVEQK